MSAREVGCGCLQSWNNAGGAAGACSCPDLLGNSVVFYVAELGLQSESEKPPVTVSVWSENVSVSSSAEMDGFQLLVPERETAKGHGN